MAFPAFLTALAPLPLTPSPRAAVCTRRAAVSRRPAGLRMLGGAAPPTPPPADGDDKSDAPAAAEASTDAAAAPEAASTPDVQAEDAPAADAETTADDILSSPAFLKKKMEQPAPAPAPEVPSAVAGVSLGEDGTRTTEAGSAFDKPPEAATAGQLSWWIRTRRSMLTALRVIFPFLPLPDPTADDDVASLLPGYQILTKELNESNTEKEALAATVAKEKDSYLRLAADFDNVRRRSSTQLASATTSATSTVVKKLLPALDNFERAASVAKPTTPGEEKLHTSYQAIQKQLLTALKELGVEPLDTVGVAFDPNEHDAINRMESTEYAEGVVCAQLQRGYKGAAGVIRPAVVVVSVGPGPPVVEVAADAAEAADEPDALDVEVSAATDVVDSVTAADSAEPTKA